MSDETAFLRAVRADPDRAELIRVQVELEPIQDRLDSPRRRELADRETELLALHGDRWLGPAKDVAAAYPGYGPVFRRGFPESVSLSLDAFLKRGGDRFAGCPTLREACVYGVAGRGAELAACPHLAQVETLEIADWLTDQDEDDVRTSPLVSATRALRLWWPTGELAYHPNGSDDRPDRVERLMFDRYDHADEYEGWLYDVQLRRNRFPLYADLGHGRVAGRVADGTAAVVAVRGATARLWTFRDNGEVNNWLTESCLAAEWTADMLRDRFGFTPGLIHVGEFHPNSDFVVRLWPAPYVRDYLTDPFDRPAGVSDRWWNDRGGVLKRWLHEGRFVIEWDGRELTLDHTGTVISS